MEVSERDRRSLKDLAKLASGPAKPKTKSMATPDSSGFVDLAALAATDPDWLEQAVARAKKAHVAIAEKEESIDLDEAAMGLPRRGRRARKIALGIVALAAAGAVAMFVVRTRHPEPAPIVVSAPPQGASAIAAPAPVPSDIPAPPAADEGANASATNGAGGANASATASTDAPEANAEESAEPAKPEPAKKGAHGRTARAHAGGPSSAPIAPKSDVPKVAPRAGGPQPKFLAGIAPAAATPAPAAPPQSVLGDAMKQASGAQNAAPVAKAAPPPPAAPNTSGLPDLPPKSAVQSALKGAMPAARACLHAGDPDMHVVVVFGSSGTPKSIQATGTGASCVQSAFSRARVPPFAQPSTSAGFTVRPN